MARNFKFQISLNEFEELINDDAQLKENKNLFIILDRFKIVIRVRTRKNSFKKQKTLKILF